MAGAKLKPQGSVHLLHNDHDEKSLYTIAEEPSEPRILPLGTSLSKFLHILTCAAWCYYLGARSLLVFQSPTWSLVLLLCLEFLLAGPDLQQLADLSLQLVPVANEPRRKQLRLVGDAAPNVQVFVTVCGEDVDTIMDTVIAAAFQGYPKSNYQIFILDDGASDHLKQTIERFNDSTLRSQAGCRRVVYLARIKTHPHYYKAGNLNFGMAQAANIFEAEYFAALDADMIPERDWLARTVPHLILDPTLGMVSPPQYMYNVPENDPLGEDNNFFRRITEPIRDRFGGCQCSGSGYVARRSAFASIGGWPLVNMGEDLVCSYVLSGEGWKLGFIDDALQWGQSAGSIHAYISQQIRWTAGSILLARKFHFFVPSLFWSSKRTVYHSLCGLLHIWKIYGNAMVALPLLLLPLGQFWSYCSHSASLDRDPLRGIFLVLWLSHKLWRQFAFRCIGLQNMTTLNRNRYWLAPYHAYCMLKTLFTDLGNSPFTVTGTFSSPLAERSEQRAPLRVRMLDPLMLCHSVYFLVLSAFTLACIMLAGKTRLATGGGSTGYLHTALLLRLLDMVSASRVPVWYMVFPPTVPERRQLLMQDEQGVWRSQRKTWFKRERPNFHVTDACAVALIFVLDWM